MLGQWIAEWSIMVREIGNIVWKALSAFQFWWWAPSPAKWMICSNNRATRLEKSLDLKAHTIVGYKRPLSFGITNHFFWICQLSHLLTIAKKEANRRKRILEDEA
jgi:hypothetical protein